MLFASLISFAVTQFIMEGKRILNTIEGISINCLLRFVAARETQECTLCTAGLHAVGAPFENLCLHLNACVGYVSGFTDVTS